LILVKSKVRPAPSNLRVSTPPPPSTRARLGDNSQYAIDYLGDKNANTLTGTHSDEILLFASTMALRLMALLLVLPNTI
jgi:hypothetical protein